MLFNDEQWLKAVCIDKRCQAVIYIRSSDRSVQCFQCGQKFSKDSLLDLQVIPAEDMKGACTNILKRVFYNKLAPNRGPEMVKVLGLSNYYCKLLSPLLTQYGMDKNTGRAKLLSEMNQGDIFNCSTLGDRAFMIEPEHVNIAGFGNDTTGSLDYLSETRKLIFAANGGEERLIPIHADGDGHCLVHAISRALVGRELFWHPLRCCLKKHFQTNLQSYKDLFKDFIDTDEWACIIEECDPNFRPPDGELHGLRNIHIFGLANVLKRPIILLDSLDCMKKCGDYSALFVPGFVEPQDCRGKDSMLNKPLCIAWSSPSHNHYIPLVGIQNHPLPILPAALIPKVWGLPQSQISSYMELDSSGNCVIGGDRVLKDAYIQRLVHAMEVLYYELNGIHPSLVADYKLFYCSESIVPPKPTEVLERAKNVVQESRLYRCLFCKGLNEFGIDENVFADGVKVNQIHQILQRMPADQIFMIQGYCLKYDRFKNEVFVDWSRSEMQQCHWCSSNSVRRITSDGTVIFKPEDKDNPEKAAVWFSDQNKRIYPDENIFPKLRKNSSAPEKMVLRFLWNGEHVTEEICGFDFQNSSKELADDYVKGLTSEYIRKYFPSDTNNEMLEPHVYSEVWSEIKKHLPSISAPNKTEPVKTEQNIKDTPIQPKPQSSELRCVKVQSSNGLSANFTLLDEGISFGKLQKWIEKEFNIPVPNQRIKLGYPLKEIVASEDTDKQMLSLSHGDRIMVEIISNKDGATKATETASSAAKSCENEYTKFQTDVLWDFMKMDPNNFRCNGDIYKQIADQHTLTSNLHISLDGFQEKTFTYNSLTNSIELCVKPLGHFLISSDIDFRIQQVKNGEPVIGFCKCPLLERLERMSEAHRLKKSFSTRSTDSSSNRPFVRKGPGFSVLSSPPEDMDLS